MYANTAAGGSNTSPKVEPVNKSQLRKSDRSQSGSNIRSGSYDNIPTPARPSSPWSPTPQPMRSSTSSSPGP